MARAAFLLACLLGLQGCGFAALTFAGANVATVIHADKTIPDMALSAQREENCSLLHASRNEAYCQPAPPEPEEALAALANKRYCYRTLGRIDCYNRPDFLASGHTRVNFTTGFLPAGEASALTTQRQTKGVPMAGIPAPAEAAAESQAASPPSPPATKNAPKRPPGGKNAKGAPAALSPPALAAKTADEAAPPQKGTPVTSPALAGPGITGTPVAQVPPLDTLPGQGTY